MRRTTTSNLDGDAQGAFGAATLLERRVCRSCKEEKPDVCFYMHPLGIRGRRATCKSCCKKWNRTENHKAASRRWNAENKPKKSAIAKAYKQTPHGRMKRIENKRKSRAQLSRGYVSYCLTQKTKLKTSDLPMPLIDAARAVIQLKREIWHNQRTSKN